MKDERNLAALLPLGLAALEASDPALERGAEAHPGARFQFEREGYFVADRVDHRDGNPVFNKTIGLRDTWQRTGGGA